jgi:hypothetical protein
MRAWLPILDLWHRSYDYDTLKLFVCIHDWERLFWNLFDQIKSKLFNYLSSQISFISGISHNYLLEFSQIRTNNLRGLWFYNVSFVHLLTRSVNSVTVTSYCLKLVTITGVASWIKSPIGSGNWLFNNWLIPGYSDR